MKLSINLTQLSVLILSFSLLTIVSCQKENSQYGTDAQEEESSRVSSESSGEAEVIFNGIFDDAMGANNEVGLSGTGVFYGRTDTLTPVSRCFTVTVTRPNNTPFPVRIVVDFGTAGCPGPDGHVRRGKVITEYTNRLIIPGATATTTFDGYYVDETQVEGTHKISNLTTATLPVTPKFRVEVINGKLSKLNGNFVEWNSVKYLIQVEGMITPEIPRDDIFRIEGNSRGRVKRGTLLVGWESSIIEPLYKRFTCRWIVKGKIKTVRINAPSNTPWVSVLDFGNGICDNQAVLTVNGRSFQISLP